MTRRLKDRNPGLKAVASFCTVTPCPGSTMDAKCSSCGLALSKLITVLSLMVPAGPISRRFSEVVGAILLINVSE